MDIRGMHYDFKKKLDKADGGSYRNLLVPEIDWALNEAQEVFVKMVAFPRRGMGKALERGQRSVDDIRTLVAERYPVTVVGDRAVLPPDYWHFIGAEVLMEKGNCTAMARLRVQRHDDEFEKSPFDRSSFEWRAVNGTFSGGGITLYDDGTFTNKSLLMDYVKRPPYMHSAADHRGGGYKLPDGTLLTGTVDCTLPEHVHREVVDLAVLITTGELHMPDYQVKRAKLAMTN